jgi:hypothetical protein
MIEKLSWNVQKEGRFGTNAYLGSGSGSQLAKNRFYQDASTRLAHCTLLSVFSASTTSMDCDTGPSLMDSLTEIRNSLPEVVKDLISKLDPELLAKLLTMYLDSLDDKDRVIFRASLLCYYATAWRRRARNSKSHMKCNFGLFFQINMAKTIWFNWLRLRCLIFWDFEKI